MKQAFLGCIADDFTGATDLANNLVRSGLRVIQTIGVPESPLDDEVDAVVIALKSRTIPSAVAVEQSLHAARWLCSQGADQIYFKYCSTFDSTKQGNIGPVTEALMNELGADFTIACPAFPDNARTIFKGYLFVGNVLLHESGMRNHPLTPMTNSNLVEVLQEQTNLKVGLIDYKTVAEGADAITKRIAELKSDDCQIAIVDAVSNQDLLAIGSVAAKLKLITAGSGVAIGLTRNAIVKNKEDASALPPAVGLKAIVSGSCSIATNEQVAHFLASGGQGFPVDPMRIAQGEDMVSCALEWAKDRVNANPILIYATAAPESVRHVQEQLGIEKAGELVEHALSEITKGLVQLGVRQLIVAGGETSGACVQALEISQMRIGPQIAPGVPWCHAKTRFASSEGAHITLKSGNFGAPDFFTNAFSVLE